MALIKCPDCERRISDSAPSCPECGRPSNRPSRSSLLDNNYRRPAKPLGTVLILAILAVPIVFVWFTLGRDRTTQARVFSFGYLALTIGIFLIQSFPAIGSYDSTSAMVSSIAPAPKASEQAMKVELGTLLFDYEQNEVAADNRYQGRLIYMDGIVDRIKKDIGDNLYIILGTGGRYQRPSLQAFFSNRMGQELGALRKGDKVAVVCRVTGLMINVLAKECVFAQ